MKEILLDTHSLLWFLIGSPKLSPLARSLIDDPGVQPFLSVASLWEIAIKVSLGKLVLAPPLEELISHHSDVQTFLLCAKQPLADHLKEYGYVKISLPGVYRSHWYSWLPPVILLSLNELSDAPHNAWVKCFASQLKEKRKAFRVLRQLVSTWKLPGQLILFLNSLWKHWFPSLSG